MKKLLAFVVCMGSLSCTHSPKVSPYKASGVIRGMVLSNCVCCTGYVIEINGNDSSFRFNHFPAKVSFDTAYASFPMNVHFNYVEDYTCSFNHFITITAISKD